MDRQITYAGAIPLDTDLLLTNKNTMVGLGYALQAILGSGTVVDGLACTPTSPATLTVNVAAGSIYALESVDASAYGSVGSDTTHNIVKQGIVTDTSNFACPAPVTSGNSIVYLIQAAYQDVDGGSTVLPYYNASDPTHAYNGPNNSGTSQNTVRQGVCVLQVKAGVSAPTGTQTTPAPDAGFTGLWAITVANGQSTVTSGNIVQLTTAPFINPKLPGLAAYQQSGQSTYAVDTSGSANTITVALNPPLAAYTAGQPMRVKVANTTTGATVMNVNGLGNKSVVDTAGNAMGNGTLKANSTYSFTYDGTNVVVQSALGLGVNMGTDGAGNEIGIWQSNFISNNPTYTVLASDHGKIIENLSLTQALTVTLPNPSTFSGSLNGGMVVGFWRRSNFNITINGALALGTQTLSSLTLYSPGSFVILRASGPGGWTVFAASPDVMGVSSPISSSFKNLKIVTTSNSAATITADELVVADANGFTFKLTSVSQSYSTGTTGAGGLDSGSVASSTGYHEYIIYNPSTNTISSLLSTSSSSPTLPSGYTFKARVGWTITDGGSNLKRKLQYGRDAQYVVQAAGSLPTIVSGAAGSVTTPTWVAETVVGTFVPATAGKIKVTVQANGSTAVAMAAPNNNYGVSTATGMLAVAGTGGTAGITSEFLLESNSIYYAANAAACSLNCFGWTDNI